MPHGPLIACPHCATLHRRLPLAAGESARCRCCGTILYRRGRLSLAQWVALAWTSLILFCMAQGFSIATLSIQGLQVDLTFYGALRLAWDRGFYAVSALTGLVGFWLPLAQIVLTLWAMQIIVQGRPRNDLRRALRLLAWLAPWSMVSVLSLAILVSVVKVAGMAQFELGPGLPAFLVLILLLAGMARWDAHSLWRRAEDRGLVMQSGATGHAAVCAHCGCVQGPAERCRRCRARLGTGRQRNLAFVWALILAAAIFYVPANVLPVMQVQTLLGSSQHTILGGVLELWSMGSWDLALIVFIASVLVPVTKLVALVFLLLRGRQGGPAAQRQHTRLFAAVEFIGQWSMLDVFVVVLMAAMANFPGLSQITIGPAALSFGAVVVLTMLATRCFDPRLGWDAVRWRQHHQEDHG